MVEVVGLRDRARWILEIMAPRSPPPLNGFDTFLAPRPLSHPKKSRNFNSCLDDDLDLIMVGAPQGETWEIEAQ